jgi:site-specific DNA recombinase
VTGAAAELERTLIAARMAAGEARKSQRGGYVGGRVPVGFTLTDNGLVPDDDQQQLIDRIVALRGTGRTYEPLP